MRRCLPTAVAAVVVAGSVAACTSSAGRHPSVAVSTRTSASVPADPSSAPTLPSGPASSGTAVTSSATSAVPSPSRTAPGVPACAPTVITVAKAPFCYTLPHGFTNYSSLPRYGTGWTYRTLVSIGQHDLVEVFAAGNPDTDKVSEAALKSMYQRVFLLKVGVLGISQADAPRRTSVDGARAYRQVARYKNGVTTDITTVYRGRTVLSIQCQSLDQKAVVEAACTSVQASLDFVRR